MPTTSDNSNTAQTRDPDGDRPAGIPAAEQRDDVRARLAELWQRATPSQVSRALEYPDESLVDQFTASVNRYGDRPALDFFGKRTSFTELGTAVATAAVHLRELGVGPGSHVALLMPTCPQHVVAFYAVLTAGATVVEHNPLFTSAELAPLFADHHADVAIVWDAAAPLIQGLPEDVRPSVVVSINMIEEMPLSKRALLSLPIKKARASRDQLSQPAPDTIPWRLLQRPVDPSAAASLAGSHPSPDDEALILYTSGTVAGPKGVPLTHRNMVANTAMALEWVWNLEPGNECFMAVLPLFHVFGCSLSMNAGLATGAMIHLIPKPEVSLILDACRRRVPTLLIAVPPLFERVADAAAEKGVSLAGCRTGISGAMPLSPDLIEKWEVATGGLLIEGYGLSETSPILVGNPVAPTRKARKIGIPFPDTEIRLVDPENPTHDVALGERGEIIARGPQVFAGYRNRPEETDAAFVDGWFRTGDIAVADDDGFLQIVDRIKEVVITGGFNVYPSEVESALKGLDGIADAAVVGLVNDLGGEEVVAALVVAEGFHVDLDDIRTRIRETLTGYKVPRKLFVLPELPRNPMGKVLRREVRSALEKVRAEGSALLEKGSEILEHGAEIVEQKAEELADKVRGVVGREPATATPEGSTGTENDDEPAPDVR